MNSVINVVVLVIINIIEIYAQSVEDLPPPCFSEIYCHGRLLETIQLSQIYVDSKTFVDMKMKNTPNVTLSKFDQFMTAHNSKPTRDNVIDFLKANFEPAGMEFEDWDPSDWKSNPAFINSIQVPEFRSWLTELHGFWKVLGRKMKQSIKENSQYYSIIWVPNPVIVPGGRFREYYYWDSYWIMQGLLLSEMNKTVEGMLENFIYILEQYGHIPNGGRIYYLARSQPPLFIPMVKLYLDYTKNYSFLRKHIQSIEKEFKFWINTHTKVIKLGKDEYRVGLYGDKSSGPRPESYREDIETGKNFPDSKSKHEFYAELKAGAESGWDFSSRWFVSNDEFKGNLTNTKIRSIVPVDLNSMLCGNAKILAEFFETIGDSKNANKYHDIASQWQRTVEAVLWHEEVGAWLDYDTINEVKRNYFYPSNLAPLWSECYNKSDKTNIVKRVLKYLRNQGILYPGGVPTSVEHTGEQWDYPNAWPPLQHMLIVGLNNTGDEFAMRLAFEMAERWVRSNYIAFKDKKKMYEKYDATTPGIYGGGGEYEVQLGFGWTNGVIMDLLYRYSDLQVTHLHPSSAPPSAYTASPGISSITTALIALLVSLTAGFIGVLIYKRRTQKQIQLVENKRRPSTARYTELKNIPKNTKTVRWGCADEGKLQKIFARITISIWQRNYDIEDRISRFFVQ